MQTKETMVSPRQKILSDCGEKENGIVSEDLPKTCKALQALIAVVQDLKQQQRARVMSREEAVAAARLEIEYYEGARCRSGVLGCRECRADAAPVVGGV